MDTNEIISSGVLELYAMGLASPEEVLQVEGWAAQYPEVRAELDAIQNSLETYAQANAVPPGDDVKKKLFSRISNTDDTTATPVVTMSQAKAKVLGISPVWKYAAAASILLFITSAVFTYTYYNKYGAASTELASVKTELQKQKDMAAMMKKDMDMMSDPNAVPVSLDKVSDMDGAARIYWMKDTKEVYIDPTHMPAPPKGKQYQFWAIVEGKPVSGGMINMDEGSVKANINGMTVHLHKMKSFGKAEAFAVSVEDAGPEKEKPDHVVVVGKVSL